MISDFISETLRAMFQPLKTWIEASTDHWNMLIGIGFILFSAGIILVFLCYRTIGKQDESNTQLYYQSVFVLLSVLVLCDLIFPKEYMWQLFFLYKYALAFLACGIYLAFRYIKDGKGNNQSGKMETSL